MSTKIFKRAGVVFFCGPVFMIGLSLHIFLVLTAIIWCPIYYIITGDIPIDGDKSYPLDLSKKIIDWYFNHFNPE
jgi:hypothetical protein